MARRRLISIPSSDSSLFVYAAAYSAGCYAAVHALTASIYGDPTVRHSALWAYPFFALALVLPALLAWQIHHTWKEVPLWATLLATAFYAVGFFFFLLPAFLPLHP